MFVPTHPIQGINENFPITSGSNQEYQSFLPVHPPGSYIPHQGGCSQSISTSPPLFGPPPHPHFVRPRVHNANSWGILPSRPPPPPSADPDQISHGWNASCSHPQSGQASRSRLPRSYAGVLIPTPADPYHPRGDSWWSQDNALPLSGRSSHQTHRFQIFDSISPDCSTSHLAHGLNNFELLYPSLPLSLLTTSLV